MNRVLYYILYGFSFLISMLPYRALYLFSDLVVYPIVYLLVGYRRKVVRENIRNSFPKKGDRERKDIERKFYHFFCDYILETLKLLTVRKETLMRRMVMKGLEDLQEAFRTNDMVFVYLGHFCNWEYIASLQWWVSGEVQCAQIYSTLRNPAFDRLFMKIRSRFGGINIEKNHSLRTIMEQKRRKQKTVIGFIADQGPRWVNIHLFVKFLHQDTAVFTGTERIARKVNATVFVAHVSRPKRGYYECRFVPLAENVRESVEENDLTRMYMRDLEKQIEKYPHLWLWSHKRWRRKRTDEDAPEEWKATIRDGQILSDTPVHTPTEKS